jgi:hypothetical protein
MAALIEAINIKRRTLFEFENTPFSCMDAEISTPTALRPAGMLDADILNSCFGVKNWNNPL